MRIVEAIYASARSWPMELLTPLSGATRGPPPMQDA